VSQTTVEKRRNPRATKTNARKTKGRAGEMKTRGPKRKAKKQKTNAQTSQIIISDAVKKNSDPAGQDAGATKRRRPALN
jgi:hypothetical protein